MPAFYNGEVPRVHAEGWEGKGEGELRKRGRKLRGPVGPGLETRPNWSPDHKKNNHLDACVRIVHTVCILIVFLLY